MIVLGLSGALGHDPSAALLVDGEVVAAAEEERFTRVKHAEKCMPLLAARYCLDAVDMDPRRLDAVAFPYAPVSLLGPARWHYARRHWHAPDRALDAILNGNRRYRRNRARVLALGNDLGIDWTRTTFVPVEHHLAHASSAYHLSGFEGRTAILGVDGKGEYATTFFGVGEAGAIGRIREFYDPDSLAGVYGALTEYLGFRMLDGEYKVMGMAPYGDPGRFDFAPLLGCREGNCASTRGSSTPLGCGVTGTATGDATSAVAWCAGSAHLDVATTRTSRTSTMRPPCRQPTRKRVWISSTTTCGMCSPRMEAWCSPAAVRSTSSSTSASWRVRMCTGCSCSRRPATREPHWARPPTWPTPAAIAWRPWTMSISGPPSRPPSAGRPSKSVTVSASKSLTTCRVVRRRSSPPDTRWRGSRGRMEFGPRALGARSILGCPGVPGMAARINAEIKYRERWRPFCPSMTDDVAESILGCRHPAPFMTITFDVDAGWRKRIPEVVHVDGTARPQVVTPQANPRYHALLQRLGDLTGAPVVLNTSLNRRGEPIACTPEDALAIFTGSDLGYLVMEDLLVTKHADRSGAASTAE